MILKILKCIFIFHQITVSTCCLSVQEAIFQDTSLCRGPGLVHPLLREIHQTVSDRITQGFDKGDLDLYMEVGIHMTSRPCHTQGVEMYFCRYLQMNLIIVYCII